MIRGLPMTAAVVVLGAATLVSCGGDGGGTGPGEDEGRIEAEVTLDDEAAQGVSLRLFQQGGGSALATQTTAADGRTAFGDLAAGSYEVEVAVPAGAALAAGEAARKPANVVGGGTATVAFGLVSAGVGGGGGEVEVLLTGGLRFSPSSVTISPGTTVVWRNDSAMLHTVTPDGHSEWTSATLNQEDQTFSHTFDEVGTYEYYCQPHRGDGMTGVITVQ